MGVKTLAATTTQTPYHPLALKSSREPRHHSQPRAQSMRRPHAAKPATTPESVQRAGAWARLARCRGRGLRSGGRALAAGVRGGAGSARRGIWMGGRGLS